jgi:hypothetical protein
MNRNPLLLLALALIPFVAVGCDKKTGTTTTTPNAGTSGTSTKSPSSSLPELPSDIPPQIKDAVERVWPKMEAAGAEIEAAFKSAQASREAGKPPSAADVTRAKNAQAQTEEWAEIWNVLNDLADDGKISKTAQKKTETFLRAYDQKITAWNKKAKGIKELSTVK